MEPTPLNDMRPTPPPASADHSSRGSLVGIVVLILVVLLVAGMYLSSSPLGEDVEMLEDGNELVTAREGEIVSDFPEGILPEGIVIVSSQSIRYNDSGAIQPVVTYNSGMSMWDTVAEWGDYFADESRGWTIVHAADPLSTDVDYFYATRGNENLNITLIPSADDANVEVTVAYLMLSDEAAEAASEEEAL